MYNKPLPSNTENFNVLKKYRIQHEVQNKHSKPAAKDGNEFLVFPTSNPIRSQESGFLSTACLFAVVIWDW